MKKEVGKMKEEKNLRNSPRDDQSTVIKDKPSRKHRNKEEITKKWRGQRTEPKKTTKKEIEEKITSKKHNSKLFLCRRYNPKVDSSRYPEKIPRAYFCISNQQSTIAN